VDPESILVVDDDRDVASTVSEYLTREGHTVILAHSGRDGLTRLREGAVALLLVDLRLPDMDGIEVMHAAQRAPNPPEIVVITGYATVSSAVQVVEGGTAGYLEKPFEMPRLAAIVQRVMGRRRLMRENMHLQAETASRLREMEVMLSISRTASATLDVQEALRRICRELVFLVGADTGAAYLLDEPSGRLMPTAGYHVRRR
jgi:DNA-binding NtrC family response regulator